ncbi:uncharacterized protein LOC111324674 [Stylophora pistillata]|uniref:uncharacterized protein LOC111324674 n=1 Tax=Stylophora pistillata TaxID=50429 RepID=UPI000C04E335|nr:uncharacterized protein LOC111324674 [Stylophora pistillata]
MRTVINSNNSLVCPSPDFCNREFSFITEKTLENQNTFQFYFSGCGWKAKSISWKSSDILWIKLLDKLLSMMFGEDFFEYVFDEKRTCHVHDDFKPHTVYNRHEWNCEYENICNSFGFTSKMHGASHRGDAVPVDEHLHQTPSNVTGKENTLTDQDRVIAVFPPPPAVAKIQILQMDLATLKDGMEVNDSIVDFFLIPDERYVKASQFTRRVDIFKKNLFSIQYAEVGIGSCL